MIDAHVHMDLFHEDLPEALRQIRGQEILTVGVAMDIPSFQETLRIAETEPLILPAFGVHPWEASRYGADLSMLDTYLDDALLIGEIGLDRHFVTHEKEYPIQELVFSYFLDAAEDRGRVVNLHTKGAEGVVLEHLLGRSLPGIIVHWYSGPLELVDQYLELGGYFSVGVEVLRSDHIRELARLIPEERLLTETDNPGGWEWMEGEMGLPDLVNRVEDALAEVRGVDRHDLSARITGNMAELLARGGVSMPEPRQS
jgi:TatD DNase family protein